MRFGPYTVDLRERKEGGQAFVYFSLDPSTGEHVAVKVARPSDWSRRRMKEEIKVQSKLDHPNTLSILAHDEEAFAWHATTRAECSLEDLGPFPREQWSYLRTGLIGIASAVKHAHSMGYIHRDLSTGNILIFADRWVVADWGFVYVPPKKGAPRMTQPLERFGTPEFMAPEMVLDPRNAREPADIYAIGRLAVWGTGLERGQSAPDDDPTVLWWRRLIDGTTAFEPEARWTMLDVHTHLRAKAVVPDGGAFASDQRLAAPAPISRRADSCPHCRSQRGYDAAEHCLGCHAILPY